jgi:hypothetical protein
MGRSPLILYIFSHVGPSLSMFDLEKCVLIIVFHHEGPIFWGKSDHSCFWPWRGCQNLGAEKWQSNVEVSIHVEITYWFFTST